MYTMILADDEEIELKALGLLIQKEFHDVEVVATAHNGTELVAQVQRHQPRHGADYRTARSLHGP